MDSTSDLKILIDGLVEINLRSHKYKESMMIFTCYRRFVIKSVKSAIKKELYAKLLREIRLKCSELL